MAMSNETFAILTMLAVGGGMSLTCGILYVIIVRLDPVQSTRAVKQTQIAPTEELGETIALQLRDNAARTNQIVRDARRLADQIEGLSKAMLLNK